MAMTTFIVDVDKCTGCKMCVVSCKDEHVGADYAPWARSQPERGQFWVDIVTHERGRQPRVMASHMALFCQHCADAPCIAACPEDAIKTRADGLVYIDAEPCTGCGACQPACPYGVIFMNAEAKIAQKCNGCAHRVDEGQLPRCVDVCPHDAIILADAAALAAPGKPLEPYLPETGAKPRVLWRGLPKPWIAGAVIDPAADEVVIGAQVAVRDPSGAEIANTRTDAFGEFRVRELRDSATYTVEIAADGYRSQSRTVTTKGDQDLGSAPLTKA